MKKTLQILFFSTLSVVGFSQSKTSGLIDKSAVTKPKMNTSVPVTNNHPVATSNSGNRDDFFYENFSNGYSGNNGVGPWTTSHLLSGTPNNQGTMWTIGVPGYINTWGGTTSDALTSQTPNQFALWDGAAYDAEYNPNGNNPDHNGYTAYLTSPAIDCSSLSSVQVDFFQNYRYCCLINVQPFSLEVSNDGGITWASFATDGTTPIVSNIQSVNPVRTLIDISCSAAGQSNVQIRFVYNAAKLLHQTAYFWGIDDVRINESPYENNISITEITNANIDINYQFRVTPWEQRVLEANGGITVGVRYGNKGTATQENVRFAISLHQDTQNGPVVFSDTTDAFTAYSIYDMDAPGYACPDTLYGNAMVFYTTGWEVAQTGLYHIRVEALSAEEDPATIADNVMYKSIRFSATAEFGHDWDNLADFNTGVASTPVSGQANTYNPTGAGNMFTFHTLNGGTTAHGVTVRFTNSTAAAVSFKVLLKYVPLDGVYHALESLDDIGLGEYETRTGYSSGEPLYFAFNDQSSFELEKPAMPVPILNQFPTENPNQIPELNGGAYFAGVWRSAQGQGAFGIRAVAHDDTDLSSRAVDFISQGSQPHAWLWGTAQELAPSVRLILSSQFHTPIGVQETETPLTNFLVYPNPAINEARVSFSVKSSSFIAYEVRDLQGRLIDTDNVGRFGTGENSFSLNVSKYPAGNYIVGLVVEGSQMFTQQISVVR